MSIRCTRRRWEVLGLAGLLVGLGGVLLAGLPPTAGNPPDGLLAATVPPAALAPAAGRILVASRDLGDPNFRRTVVILTRYGQSGAMGVVINRRSRAKVAEAFRDLPEASARDEVFFTGGPVERGGALALIRARKQPQDSQPVLPGVYLISSRQGLVDVLRQRPAADSLRFYLGYAGWTGGQLEAEIDARTWHVERGDAALVFDASPESLWNRIIQRGDTSIAAAKPENQNSSSTSVPAANFRSSSSSFFKGAQYLRSRARSAASSPDSAVRKPATSR